MNNNDTLDKKNYMKWDRTFMAFGSIMNSWHPTMTAVTREGATREAWNLAKELVSGYVDDLYSAPVIDTEEKPL